MINLQTIIHLWSIVCVALKDKDIFRLDFWHCSESVVFFVFHVTKELLSCIIYQIITEHLYKMFRH